MQHPFGAKSVNASCGNARSRPWTIVEAKLVLVAGWIRKVPDGAPGTGIEAFDRLLIDTTVEQNEFVVGHHRTTESVANFLLPDHRRNLARPTFNQIEASINPIASWAQELGPIIRLDCCRDKRANDQNET